MKTPAQYVAHAVREAAIARQHVCVAIEQLRAEALVGDAEVAKELQHLKGCRDALERAMKRRRAWLTRVGACVHCGSQDGIHSGRCHMARLDEPNPPAE